MKEKITIKTTDKDVEVEIDLEKMKLKAQGKQLTNDDIQLLFNYLLNK
jgi:urease accessory protein UreE